MKEEIHEITVRSLILCPWRRDLGGKLSLFWRGCFQGKNNPKLSARLIKTNSDKY